MEMESEENLVYLEKTLEKDSAKGQASTWDMYLLFNAQEADKLRAERILKNIEFAQRSKKRMEVLQEAESKGVLFIES